MTRHPWGGCCRATEVAKWQPLKTKATDTGGWSRTFDYDQFGNLWASAGTNLSAQTPSTADWIDEGTNRLASESGQFSYDAAGNLTQYGTGAALTYDAENRMTAAGTLYGAVQYFYDGLGTG